MSADQLFHQQDRRDERAEEQRALHEMPGLLPLFEAIDFVHAVLGRNYKPYRGMMISTTRLPRPLEFVYVVQIWHCENGFLQYANGFGEPISMRTTRRLRTSLNKKRTGRGICRNTR